jgi:glycosyltransferase involved in cell wall biosynthesis
MKILYVTTISLTMNTFFKAHIDALICEGHQVDLACNYAELELDKIYSALGCKFYQIDFSRSPLAKENFRAYKQLKKVIQEGEYNIVHCHTPNASVITRLVCRKFRKKGLRVFYTAHGFHFYKGAPKLNWLVYYPIEKYCSRFTDKLITINKEDYALAKKNFKAKEVDYIPGVGIDLSKFKNIKVNKKEKRKEIGIPPDAFLMLSVGELNKNKNHQVILRAMAKLNDPTIHYAIAGQGIMKEYLLDLAKKLGVEEQFHLLGFRKDIPQLNYIADVFCFPSHREGLGLAAIEAMACGLPLITSNVHGINDYSIEGKTGYKCAPLDVNGFVSAITKLRGGELMDLNVDRHNKGISELYACERIVELVKQLYEMD